MTCAQGLLRLLWGARSWSATGLSSDICVYLALRLMLCWPIKESYRKRLAACTCCLAVLIGSGVSVDRR